MVYQGEPIKTDNLYSDLLMSACSLENTYTVIVHAGISGHCIIIDLL